MLLVWGSICDGQSHPGLLLDVFFNSVFAHLSRSKELLQILMVVETFDVDVNGGEVHHEK